MADEDTNGGISPTKTKSITSSDESPLRPSLSTSSSSSTAFNSWTILPAERIELLDSICGSNEDETALVRDRDCHEAQEQEQEQDDDKHANDRCMRPLDDVQAVGAADDISDGISIISDCESTERISPHPFLRDHFNEMLHFNDLSAPIVLTSSSSSSQSTDQQLKDRRHLLSEDTNSHTTTAAAAFVDDNELLPTQQTSRQDKTDNNLILRQQISAISGYQRLPQLVQNGLTAIFYVGATLAILAFIGKLRHPEWESGNGDGKSLINLERRLDELELQNNLMRAEIDLISKQLQYLSSDQANQGRKGKTFKAWSGNGDAGQPVDITKEDLKRPFKCQDGKYVEFAAMCMESKKSPTEHVESLYDEIGNVVNDVLQQSQTFQRFEKVTDRIAASTNPDEDIAPGNGNGDFSKQQQQQRQKKMKCSSESSAQACSHQHYSREEQQLYKNQRHYSNSKENDSKEDQRYKKKYYKDHHDDSDERQYRDKKQQYMAKDDDNSGSGEWHGQRMKQRENLRKRSKDNWYIERGDSREQKRSGETKR